MQYIEFNKLNYIFQIFSPFVSRSPVNKPCFLQAENDHLSKETPEYDSKISWKNSML